MTCFYRVGLGVLQHGLDVRVACMKSCWQNVGEGTTEAMRRWWASTGEGKEVSNNWAVQWATRGREMVAEAGFICCWAYYCWAF